MYGTKAGVNQPDPARLFRLLQRDSLIAHNWCFPAVRRLEAIGGKAGLAELFTTKINKMNIIRDESQDGMKTPCISMIPLLVQWQIKRCNIEHCGESPTTIVAGIKDVPVFGLCESHFSEFTKEDKAVNIVLDFG